MRLTGTDTFKLLTVVILLAVGMTGSFLSKSLAQDIATERPFPVAATHTPAPLSPSPSQQQQQPTERPFPGVRTTALTSTSAAVTVETTTEATAEATAALTTGDALATAAAAQSAADQLRSENKSLQDQLASAQTDKGATLYAIVIVVIGALLAFGVFFGLRRSGK